METQSKQISKIKIFQKHRIYPNVKVQIQLAKQEGCNRFVWNETLAHMKRLGHWLTYGEMCHFLFHELKPMFPFLSEVSAQSLQQSLVNLDAAIKNYFRDCKRYQIPRFKKKRSSWGVRFCQRIHVDREKSLLFLTHLKKNPVKIILERDLPKFTMTTITRDADGHYHASFIVEREVLIHDKNDGVRHVGLDLGLKNYIVGSNGLRVSAPQFLRKSEKRIVKQGKHLSRKTRGSKRYNKCQRRLARIHAKVRRQRNNWIHQLSHQIVNNKDTGGIGVESLRIKNMILNRCLSKSISDASWGAFIDCLEYKLILKGKSFIRIGRNFASTQYCSSCYQKTGPKSDLKVRIWTCMHCGATHDRDFNAAKNIALEADRIYGIPLPLVA